MNYPIIYSPINEVFSVSEAEKWVRADYSHFIIGNLAIDKWVAENLLSYYIVANTWVLIAYDLTSVHFGNLLRKCIREMGLTTAIRWSADMAGELITYYHKGIRPSMSTDGLAGYQRELLTRLIQLKPQDALQVLRYPKRFSLTVSPKNSKQHLDAIQAFRATEKVNFMETSPRINIISHTFQPRVCGKDRTRYNIILKLARRLIRKVVGHPKGFGQMTFPYFGTGSARNCGKSLAERYCYLVQHWAYTPSLPVIGFIAGPTVDFMPTRTVRYSTKDGREVEREEPNVLLLIIKPTGITAQICRLSTVPKNCKVRRLIAIEDPISMSMQLYLKEQLERCIRLSPFARYMPLKDQSVMQGLAREGVRMQNFATVDLSHASDSVTWRLVQELFPDDWVQLFERCRPKGFIESEYDRHCSQLNMFATMGCGCTFVVETLCFWALDMATCLYEEHRSHLQYSKCFDDYLEWVECYAYGDDQIVPTEHYEAIISTLQMFGFTVNCEKSYSTGNFRESCGKDYLLVNSCGMPFASDSQLTLENSNVADVTSIYYPRSPIPGDFRQWRSNITADYKDDELTQTTSLSKIIALQQSLYGLSSSASDFISEIVRKHVPHTTTSDPGSESADLWSTDPEIKVCYFGGFEPRMKWTNVPLQFRTVPGFEDCVPLPEGYVRIDQLEQFIYWCEAQGLLSLTEKSRRNLIRDLSKYAYRSAHYVYACRATKPETLENLTPGIVQSIKYDLALCARTKNQQVFGQVNIVDQHGNCKSLDLSQACGAASLPLSEDAVFGKVKAKASWFIQ